MSENFQSGIVRVLTADGKRPAGTGFVVSIDGLVATCAHVIGEPQPAYATVIFQATGERREAQVIREWWRSQDDEDIAFLRIQGDLPSSVTPLPLGAATGTENHEIRTFGFPKLGLIEGVFGGGRTIGLGSKTQEGQQLLQVRSSEITPGFSGAPVWDTTRQCVIGMVVIVATPIPMGSLARQLLRRRRRRFGGYVQCCNSPRSVPIAVWILLRRPMLSSSSDASVWLKY